LKKYVDAKHLIIAKKFGKVMNSSLKGSLGKYPTKKKDQMCFEPQYIFLKVQKILSKRIMWNKLFSKPLAFSK